MARFIQITVGGVVSTFSAENILTVTRTNATTTFIQYNSAQAGFDTLTFVHLTDAATTYVRDAIVTAILSVHAGNRRNEVYETVVLPTGVTVTSATFT